MIDLTPLEVRKKKGDFRRAMRGYEPALVDDFLDVAADRLEQLVRENMALHEKVAELAAQVTEFRNRERALTEALVSAQELREELRRQASREVELAKHAVLEQTRQERAAMESELQQLRASAAQRASDALEDVREVRAREEELLRELRARQEEFLSAYRGFLEDELGELDVIARAAGITLGIAARPAGSSGSDEPFQPEEFIADETPDAPPFDVAGTAEDAVGAAPSVNGAQSEPVSTEPEPAEPEPAPLPELPVVGAATAWSRTPEWSTPELELVETAGEEEAIELVEVDEDPETAILLRNAAAAGYQLDEDQLPDELLLDETVTDDVLDGEEDDGWLPSLLDDDK